MSVIKNQFSFFLNNRELLIKISRMTKHLQKSTKLVSYGSESLHTIWLNAPTFALSFSFLFYNSLTRWTGTHTGNSTELKLYPLNSSGYSNQAKNISKLPNPYKRFRKLSGLFLTKCSKKNTTSSIKPLKFLCESKRTNTEESTKSCTKLGGVSNHNQAGGINRTSKIWKIFHHIWKAYQ